MKWSNLILTGCLLLSISLSCAQESDELDLDSFEHALEGHSGHHGKKVSHKEPAPVVEISEEDDGLAVDDGALVADTDANAFPRTEATIEIETEAEIQTDPPTTTTTTTTTTTEKVTTTKASTLKPHYDQHYQHHDHEEKEPKLPNDSKKSPSIPSGAYPGPLLPGSPADFLRPGSFVNPYAQPPYIAGGYSPYNPDGTLKTPPTPDHGNSEENEITKDNSVPSNAESRNQFPASSSLIPSFGGLAAVPGARILPTGLVPIPLAEKPTTDKDAKPTQPIERRIIYPYRPTSFLPWRPYPLLPGQGIIHQVPPKPQDDANDDSKEESTTATEQTTDHYGGGGHYGGAHYGGGHYGGGHYGSGHYGGGHYGGGPYRGYGHHGSKGYAYWRS